MVLLLEISGHAILHIMTIFIYIHNDKAYNGHKFQHFTAICCVVLKSGQNSDQQLRQNKKPMLSSQSHDKTIFGSLSWPFSLNFELENWPSRESTSPLSSALTFTFLESGEQEEWD